jgi:hypothetical protein
MMRKAAGSSFFGFRRAYLVMVATDPGSVSGTGFWLHLGDVSEVR